MIKTRYFLCFFILFTISFVLSLNAEDIETNDKENSKLSKKVLIAIYHTDFKDSVVSILNDKLSNVGYNVTVIDFKDVDVSKTDNFNLIIMMTWRRAFRLGLGARKLLRKLQEKEKVILLVTAVKEEWEYGDSEIDAMTCASRVEEIDSIVNKVMEKVEAHFAK